MFQIHNKLYCMITVTKTDHILSTEEEFHTNWSLTLNEKAILVRKKEDCKLVNTLYAIEYNVSDMSMKELFHIMYSHLSIKECEYIYCESQWLEDAYTAWLKGGGVQ